MQSLAPITVTAVDFDVALVADGIAAAWTPGKVRVANESPYALMCLLGADSHWLQPWSVDVWPVHAVTSMHVHPMALVTPIPTPPWSTLLVTVVQAWEDIPGTYPAALDRQSANYVQPAPLRVNPADSGIYTTAPNTALTNVVYPLPAGTTAVRYEINQLAANCKWVNNTIVGNVTGKRYNLGTGNTGGTGGFDEVWGIDPEDTALLFSIDTTGSPNAVEYWFTAPAAYTAVKVVSNGTADGLPLFVRNDSTPALWQAGKTSVSVAVSPGAAPSSVVIVPGVSGKLVYVHWVELHCSGGSSNAIELQDTAGVGFGQGVSPVASAPAMGPIDFQGQSRTLGAGLQIANIVGPAIGAIRGTIIYTQQ